MKLNRDFYNRDATQVAKDLLGKYLYRVIDGVAITARIVETEAYMGPADKAAHSYNNRRTRRTEVMFGPPGYAYVYLIYGMYSCLNVVTNAADCPQAVLIRALEPVSGLDKMSLFRYKKNISELSSKEIIGLTNGPGKLCQSLNITTTENGEDMCGNRLFITEVNNNHKFDIVTTTRINIDYAEEAIHFPWRYYIKGNGYVSKK